MKKSTIAAICVAGALVLGGGGVYAAGTIAKSNSISEDTALNFAYVDAGISPGEAEFIKTDFDFENGKFVYDIEFIANGKKYDYTINSSNGMVMEREVKEITSLAKPTQNSGNTASTGTQTESSAAQQTEGQAAQKDTEAAPQGNAGTDQSADNQGNTSKTPSTGTPAQTAPSTAPSTAPTTTPSTTPAATTPVATPSQTPSAPAAAAADIGLDKAKSIALANAGVSAGSVTFSKARLERDDGRMIYDIEFYGNGEWDYEIDAATGAILDKEYEAPRVQPSVTSPGTAPAAPSTTPSTTPAPSYDYDDDDWDDDRDDWDDDRYDD